MFMGYAYKIQQQHDSSGQKTGFYPWFQMPCGTSGTAGNNVSAASHGMLSQSGNIFKAEAFTILQH